MFSIVFILLFFRYIICSNFVGNQCTSGLHITLCYYFLVPEYRPVNLGATLGKVSSGSHTTAGFKEDKKNKATPGERTASLK